MGLESAGRFIIPYKGQNCWAINRTRVRIGLGVQCVIILMKYRFETFKQLSAAAKIAHFFTAKQSHPFYCRGNRSRAATTLYL